MHPDDLAADKVVALWGRARPRDFYDVHALMRHYTRDAFLQLAAAKDAGFTIETFLDALNAIKQLTAADWAEDGIRAQAVPQLTSVFAEWRAALTAGG